MRLFHGHEIKGGIEYETEKAQVVKRMSGGQQVDVFANEVNPSKPIYRHFYWTTPDATVAIVWEPPWDNWDALRKRVRNLSAPWRLPLTSRQQHGTSTCCSKWKRKQNPATEPGHAE